MRRQAAYRRTDSAYLHTDGVSSSLSHGNRIAHRSIKLCDFGLSIKVVSVRKSKGGSGIVFDVAMLDSQYILCGREGSPAGSDHSTLLSGSVGWGEQQKLIYVLYMHPYLINTLYTLLL